MGETRGSYNKRALVVSQTEPTNPTGGLLWYKPDLCETTTTTTPEPVITTTTTTVTPFQCPEGSVYSGEMTVGNDTIYYGYWDGLHGSLNPASTMTRLVWDSSVQNLVTIIPDCQNPIVYIDGIEFSGFLYDGSDEWYIPDVLVNPFAPVGEISNICVMCDSSTTTTTPLN